jgi:hypothetical protein
MCLTGGATDRAAAVRQADVDRGDEHRAGPRRRTDPHSPAVSGAVGVRGAAGDHPARQAGTLHADGPPAVAALTDPAAVIAHRAGALERAALLLADWLETHRRLLDTEHRMTAVLDELRLTELVTSITGRLPPATFGDQRWTARITQNALNSARSGRRAPTSLLLSVARGSHVSGPGPNQDTDDHQ